MTRHEMRESAFILLFEMKVGDFTLDEAVENSEEAFELPMDAESKKLAAGVTEHTGEFDAIIAKYSEKREVNRIATVDLIAMRIALYEMTYCDNVPDVVAINEAIELVKAYADKTDSAFVNGVLNSYLKEKDGTK